MVAFICLMTAATAPGVMGATGVDLGTAGSFAVLAKTGITDTGSASVISGDVGLSPGTGAAIVGFDVCTPSRVSGTIYKVDDAGTTCAINGKTLVDTAVVDMQLAYSNATLEPTEFPTSGGQDIGGKTFIPGAYSWTGAVIIPGDVTLDGEGDANAVWIFKTTGYLTIDASKKIILRNGAQAKNIFWVVADYTTLGENSVFNGNILDATAITLNTGATLNGRALAQSAITLNGNTLTIPVSRVAPVAGFSFTNATGTVPLTVAFTDASTFDQSSVTNSYVWDFDNDGNIDSTSINTVYVYDAAGTYTPNLTVMDSYGAVATKLDTVTVHPASVADFTFTNATGNAPLYVQFTDASTPTGQISLWAWDFGDGTNTSTENPAHTYASPGSYTVNLEVTDGSGTIATKTVTDAVTVTHAGPVADFTFTPSGGPALLTVTFTDNSTPADPIVSWAWDFGDGNSVNSTVQNPVHTYTTAAVYTVHLTVTDGSGAGNTKTITDAVTVTSPSLEITVAPGPYTLTLDPGQTPTNTDIEFVITSSTDWQVTAYDADTTNTSGFMTSYEISPSDYATPSTHLSDPLMVRLNSNDYVALPTSSSFATLKQTGTREDSGTPYMLGVHQEVKLTDPHLSDGKEYRIVVTLIAGIL